MCKANINKLTKLIIPNLNKPMLLSEWKVLVNKHLPKNRALTQRELAFAFKVIKQKKIMVVMKQSYCYCFSFFD